METIRTPEKELAFLIALAETCNVTSACKAADIARNSAYLWRGDEAGFAAKWEYALQIGVGSLEDEAVRRAKEGTDEPVFYKGVECGVIRKYSDTLLIFLLKGAKPEKYRERYDTAPADSANRLTELITAMKSGPVERGQVNEE